MAFAKSYVKWGARGVRPLNRCHLRWALLAQGKAKHARKSVPAHSGGVFAFFDFVEKRKHPTPKGSVRGPGSLTHPQVTPIEGSGPSQPMRMKLSGLPLCKAGDWGLQTPEKCFCFGFFAAKPQKNQNKKGFGAAPQREICVSFMRMGSGPSQPACGGCWGRRSRPQHPHNPVAVRRLRPYLRQPCSPFPLRCSTLPILV